MASKQYTSRDTQSTLNGAHAGRGKPPFGSNGAHPDDENDEDSTGVSVYPEPMDRRAYYGVLGQIALEIELYIEADPAALFLNLAAKSGIAVGRKPFLQRGTHYHRCNLSVVTVGRSSDGKSDGTAPLNCIDDEVRSALAIEEGLAKTKVSGGKVTHEIDTSHVDDPNWRPPPTLEIVPVLRGISTGEGLLNAIRDDTVTWREDRKSHTKKRHVEPGVADKRLLLIEGELARVFAVMAREGSTLSTLLRDLYDSHRTAESNPKGNPIKVTEPHVGMIAAITPDELNYCLHGIELSNGLVNRYLWPLTWVVKDLADPQDYTVKAREHAKLWIAALRKSVKVERVRFNKDATALWEKQYGLLKHGGRAGAPPRGEGRSRDVAGRGHVAVMRLALIFAVLEGSKYITKRMLEAAMLAWDYCERCTHYLFGDAPKQLVEDTIFTALRKHGKMTRTQINHLFSHNSSKRAISNALDALLKAKKVKAWKEPGAGRPTEWWEAP